MIHANAETERLEACAALLDAGELPTEAPESPRGLGRASYRLRSLLARPDFRNGTLSLVDQAIVSATTFATSVIIGRLCLKEELGIFSLALSIVYLARGVQEQVISAPYVVYCHGRRGAAASLYSGSSLVHQIILSALAMLLLLGVLGLLSLGIGPPELAPAVWLLIAVLPLLQLREFIRRLAIAHLEIVSATAIDLAVSVLQISGLVALAWFGRLTVVSAYATMGLACALASGLWFLLSKRPWRFAWSHAVDDWRHNWGFGRWALVSHMIGFTMPMMMPWVVTGICGAAEAGILAACTSIVGTASMFMTGLALYITPRAARGYAQGGAAELRRVLRTASTIYLGVLGSFALTVLVGGNWLLAFAYGEKYAGYGPVMTLLAFGMLAGSMGLSVGIGLWAIDRPQANLAADVCTLVVTLAIVVLLLEPLGVLAAALGDAVGRVAGSSVRYVTLRQLLKSSPPLAEA
ncbi:MAG TPA: lipopolysaccharide biosynthesis protein [Pirellulales bacterium]|nr:lipopolysaccharide biosynthesis protein [Pirellulales bacterium]